MPRVNLFDMTGQQIGSEDFSTQELADEFAKRYSDNNSGFASVLPGEETLSAAPELTPQDKGEPSPVPYSVFLQKPSPDIDPKGQTIIRMNLALPNLAECGTRGLIPPEAMPFITMADKAFRLGHYRFELIVGDWSIKVYKHPNNP